jgi:hypothetical protein
MVKGVENVYDACEGSEFMKKQGSSDPFGGPVSDFVHQLNESIHYRQANQLKRDWAGKACDVIESSIELIVKMNTRDQGFAGRLSGSASARFEPYCKYCRTGMDIKSLLASCLPKLDNIKQIVFTKRLQNRALSNQFLKKAIRRI